MEKDNKKIDVDSEEIKSETKNTINDVKESFKKTNFKEGTIGATNIIVEIFKNPLELLKQVAKDSKNQNLRSALFLSLVWIISSLLNYWINHGRTAIFTSDITFLGAILAPAFGIIALGIIVYFMQKDSFEKKGLTTILTTITIASTPLILASVISLLRLFSDKANQITDPIVLLANVVTIVYQYFATKHLLEVSENSKFIKKFSEIQFVYFVVYFIFTFLKISLPMI